MNASTIRTLDDLRKAFKRSEPFDLVHFYAHGGTDNLGHAVLQIGNEETVKFLDFESWQPNFTRRPLVILNTCDSAAQGTDSFESLVELFVERGAAGVIGTQCQVRNLLAGEVMVLFLGQFLRQASAGAALFSARQTLLARGDPRGLAYSLFASSDIRLALPVLDEGSA